MVLYAENAEITSLARVSGVVLALAMACFAAVGVGWLLTRSLSRAATYAAAAALCFWLYGAFADLLFSVFPAARHWHAAPVWLFLCAHLLLPLKRCGEAQVRRLLHAVTVIGGILFLYNAAVALPVEVGKWQRDQHDSASVSGVAAGLPNVYLIILDEFAGLVAIKDEWGYENEPLAAALGGAGFFLAEESQGSCENTLWAMANLMNLRLVDCPANGADADKAIPLYNDGLLARWLRTLGYRTVALESPGYFYPTIELRGFDEVVSIGSLGDAGLVPGLSDFERALLGYSIVSALEEFVELDTTNAVMFHGNRAFFEYLLSHERPEEPTFTYVHLMTPHPPFVFDPEGNRVPEDAYSATDLPPHERQRSLYLDQYFHASTRVAEAARRLVQEDPGAVIFIQSDHGPRPRTTGSRTADPGTVLNILNAVYVGGEEPKAFRKDMGPIETVVQGLEQGLGVRPPVD